MAFKSLIWMKGELYIYDKEKRLTAFESGPEDAESCIVVIGGLTDGFLSLPFVPKLMEECGKIGWCCVQVHLSSSYSGFGIYTIQQDAEELSHLLEYLGGARGKKRVVLLGHSTGCQGVLWYLQHSYLPEHHVGAAILQGAVSDRDHLMATLEGCKDILDWALREIAEGRPNSMHGSGLYGGIPMTAGRIRSMLDEDGDEEYFSVQTSIDRRKAKFAGIPIPTYIALCEDDEYVPNRVETYGSLIDSYKQCSDKVKLLDIIPNADHGINNDTAQEYFVLMVKEVLSTVGLSSE